MLALVSRAYLPADAKVVVREDSCVVWRSWLLNDAVGLIYARATASPQGADVPGTALIVAIPQPSCRLR